MKTVAKILIYSVMLIAVLQFGCKKETTTTPKTKYTVSYNYAGTYSNEVSQIIESDSFSMAFISVMENDSVRIIGFVYKDKTNNTSLLYRQNLTRDTAFAFQLINNEPTQNALRFHKKNDSLIMESIDYNKTNNTYFVLQKFNLGKVSFKNSNTTVLRTGSTLDDTADIQKQLDETLKYLGQTAPVSWFFEQIDNLTNTVNQLANQLSNAIKDFKNYLKNNAQATLKDLQDALAQYQKEQEEIKKQLKETDCAGVVGGSAKADDCGICSGGTSGHVANSTKDCAGVCNGAAFLDDCEVCSGGTSGHVANSDKDCAGVCNGAAFLDSCGTCVGGNTGQIACNACSLNPNITINSFEQYVCPDPNPPRGNGAFLVSFSAEGPGIIVNSTRVNFIYNQGANNQWVGIGNGISVSLYSGNKNNGVLAISINNAGQYCSGCPSDYYNIPTPSWEGWKVELVNECNKRVESGYIQFYNYCHQF